MITQKTILAFIVISCFCILLPTIALSVDFFGDEKTAQTATFIVFLIGIILFTGWLLFEYKKGKMQSQS